ncbi:Asd/ArgC dimerization domain-containing protein [Microbulbifer sp. TYP-18]|uniref:Asd/ArgC dimerization domain-containing protein n=1 Tax=Microbulbifer sp. TYP-18 TaxID=3230024 RepID=UPI0034C617F9
MSESERELVVVGVNNAVISPLLELLEERKTVKPGQLCLLEAEDCEADPQVFANRSIAAQSLEAFAFAPGQIVVLLKSGPEAQAAMAAAEQAGAWILDAAGNARGDETALLVHPLVNTADIAVAERRLLVLPVAGAAMVVEALLPLRSLLKSAEVTLNQPVSALGKAAVDAMAAQTAQMFNAQDVEVDPEIGQRLAFNILSSSEPPLPSGHNLTELSLVHDLQRLLGDEIAVDATVNTASVFHGQLANVRVLLQTPTDLEQLRRLLGNGARLEMVERPSAAEAVGRDTTLIGRLRTSLLNPGQFDFCTASDNLRKDLAMNCVQIVHLLLKNH